VFNGLANADPPRSGLVLQMEINGFNEAGCPLKNIAHTGKEGEPEK